MGLYNDMRHVTVNGCVAISRVASIWRWSIHSRQAHFCMRGWVLEVFRWTHTITVFRACHYITLRKFVKKTLVFSLGTVVLISLLDCTIVSNLVRRKRVSLTTTISLPGIYLRRSYDLQRATTISPFVPRVVSYSKPCEMTHCLYIQ